MGGILHLFFVIEEAQRVETAHRLIRIPVVIEDVSHPAVPGEIVQHPMVSRHADAGFLAGAAPVAHVVAGSDSLEFSEVIHIHIRGVAGQRLGKGEHILPLGAEEIQPQPVGRHQLRVVPGVAADVIFPDMPHCVIGVHHIAVIVEAVPQALLLFVFVEGKGAVQLMFQPLLDLPGSVPAGCGRVFRGLLTGRLREPVRSARGTIPGLPRRQAPVSECPPVVQDLRVLQEDGRLLHLTQEFRQSFVRHLRHRPAVRLDGEEIRVGGSHRIRAVVVKPLIIGLVVSPHRIMAEVIGLRLRGIEPDIRLGQPAGIRLSGRARVFRRHRGIGFQRSVRELFFDQFLRAGGSRGEILHFQPGGRFLPEIPSGDQEAAVRIAERHGTFPAVSVQRGDIAAVIVLHSLLDHEVLAGILHQAVVAPDRHIGLIFQKESGCLPVLRHRCSGHLCPVILLRNPRVPAGHQHGRLVEAAVIGQEFDLAVIGLMRERSEEADTQAFERVALRIRLIQERMLEVHPRGILPDRNPQDERAAGSALPF